MIARLAGRILEKTPQRTVVDVGGVGYGVFIPLSTFYTLPPEGSDVSLNIHTHVKEDRLALYGFATLDELALFERLIEISGVGPRLALGILSGIPAVDLMDAISEGDSGRLRGIPGVGPKTADRVVLEMRDRIKMLRATLPGGNGGVSDASRGVRGDVVSALVNLGYREKHAEDAVRKAAKGATDGAGGEVLGDLLKRSLRYLAS